MIPLIAGLPAAARIGLKVGLPILLFAGYTWIIYDKGQDSIQQKWDASLAQQAAENIQTVNKLLETERAVMLENAKELQAFRAQSDRVEMEVSKHVQNSEKPCVLDPELVRIFDSISRLPGYDADRVPSPDGGAGESHESAGTEPQTFIGVSSNSPQDLTTDELLQQVQDMGEAYGELWIAYKGLREWERGRYIVESSAFNGEQK